MLMSMSTETNDKKKTTYERMIIAADVEQNTLVPEIKDTVTTETLQIVDKSIKLHMSNEHEELQHNESSGDTRDSASANNKAKENDEPSETATLSFDTLNISSDNTIHTDKHFHIKTKQQSQTDVSASTKIKDRKYSRTVLRKDNNSSADGYEKSVIQKNPGPRKMAQKIKKEQSVIIVKDDSEYKLINKITSDMTHDKLHKLICKAVEEGKYKQMVVPIDIWDFGGQKDYYMTHQLFITSRGIFVLMFNGAIDLHKNMPDLDFLPGHFGKPTVAGTIVTLLSYCYL